MTKLSALNFDLPALNDDKVVESFDNAEGRLLIRKVQNWNWTFLD